MNFKGVKNAVIRKDWPLLLYVQTWAAELAWTNFRWNLWFWLMMVSNLLTSICFHQSHGNVVRVKGKGKSIPQRPKGSFVPSQEGLLGPDMVTDQCSDLGWCNELWLFQSLSPSSCHSTPRSEWVKTTWLIFFDKLQWARSEWKLCWDLNSLSLAFCALSLKEPHWRHWTSDTYKLAAPDLGKGKLKSLVYLSCPQNYSVPWTPAIKRETK